MKINMRCPECGGDFILKDSWSMWDYETQSWELHSTYDNEYCEDCEKEIEVLEVEE